MASDVELAPVPATTGMRPRACCDRRLDQQAVLVEIDGGRFAGGADDDDAGRAVGDVEVDQLAERGKIERAALAHRRRDRDETTGQHGGSTAKKGDFTPFERSPARRVPSRVTATGSAGGHGRPGPTAARRCTTAPGPAPATWPCSNATTVRPACASRSSSPRSQQEIRIRRPAVGFVAAREGLVEQHAVVRQRGEQGREQRPVQVIRRRRSRRIARPASGQRPASRSSARVSMRASPASVASAAASRSTATTRGTAGGEEARVAAVAAGEVQHAGAGGDERREALDPGRSAGRRARADGGRDRCDGMSGSSRSWTGAAFYARPRRRSSAPRRCPSSRAASSASHATKPATSARSAACGATTA